MEVYSPGIGISAGLMMLKWDMLNSHINNHPMKINIGDDVNVFINLETVLNNLTLRKGLNSNIAFHKKNVVIELESAILNLVAHYKSYFRKYNCNVKVYLYYTDLSYDTQQQMEVYNKYYRSFYTNKYLQNPKYRAMGELMKNIIIPELELILYYVPGCYLLKSKSFDGSVLPLVVSNQIFGKNIIITGDIFDTLYMFNPNFIVFYIVRKFKYFNVCTDIESVIRTIIPGENPFDLTIFNSEMYFRLLLAINGSKIRNIRGTIGFGLEKLISILQDGIKKDIVLRDFSSLESIINLFPEKYRDDMKTAFRCTDIETQYQMLSDSDIDTTKSQLIDKIDIESIEALNNRRFIESPINLQSLLQ